MSKYNRGRRNRKHRTTRLQTRMPIETPVAKSIIMPGEDFYTVYRVTMDNPQVTFHPMTKFVEHLDAVNAATELAAENPGSEFVVLVSISHHYGPGGDGAADLVPQPKPPPSLPDPMAEPEPQNPIIQLESWV